MNVKECMSKELATVKPTDTLTETAKHMKQKSIGSVLVLENGKLAGILTDRDIAIAVAAEGKNASSTFVQDVMRKNPKTVEASAGIEDALKIMEKEKIRRLPVVDQGKVVGILSSSDLASILKQQISQFIGLEEVYSHAGR